MPQTAILIFSMWIETPKKVVFVLKQYAVRKVNVGRYVVHTGLI